MVNYSEQEMKTMEENLDRFLKFYYIKPQVPVDIFETATNMGFDVRGVEYDSETLGSILIDESVDNIVVFNSNKVIGYNCKLDIEGKKYIVARQLAKFLIKKMNTPTDYLKFGSRDVVGEVDKNFSDREVEYYAHAFLIPKQTMKKYFYHNETVSDIVEMVKEKYNVCEELAKVRVFEVYGKADEEQKGDE